MMFPIKYNGDVLHHNARVGVDGGIVESLDFVNDLSEQTKRVNMPLLLDIYPNAAAAYSLRKLRTAYTGAAIRVRRSSDNTETDIGFNNAGDLDTSALAAFVGNVNGFVTRWYDQSGNNNNFIQTGITNQPIIVNTGTIILDNNKPIISFDGVNHFLIGGINNSQQGFVFATFNSLTDGQFRMGQADNASLVSSFSIDTIYNNPTSNIRFLELLPINNIFTGNTNINNRKILGVYSSNGTVWSGWVNSNLQNLSLVAGSNTGGWFGDYLYPMYLQRLNRSAPFNSKANVQEIIIYNSNQSPNRIGIETNINSYYRIYQQEALLLDYYPDAAAAYSLRKLRSGYTGAAIQVRRSSDNAVQNIGFDSNGGLDTTALTTFVGTGNTGFVTTWYDQSGNNRNATQSTLANQPVVFSGGTVITTNSKPSLNFDGAGDTFTVTITPLLSYTNMTTFIINNPAAAAAPDATTSVLFGVDQGGANIPQVGISVGGATGLFTGEKFTMYFSSNTVNSGRLGSSTYNHNANEQTLFSIFNLSSGFLAYKNNNFITFDLATAMTTSTPCAPANTNASNPLFHIGTINGASNGVLQKFQEVIVYPSNQSTNRPFIEANINSYYNIYPTDSDANAFVTAAGLTGTTQIQAVNKLVTDLKGYGLWGKMKAIYPFVGGTASSHKFNLKDPRDVDGAFRLVFSGTWTHTNSGADPNGVVGTFATPNILFSSINLSSFHWSYYSTEIVGSIAERCLWGVDFTDFFEVYSNNRYYAGSPVTDVIGGDAKAFHLMNRPSSSFYNIFRNSTKVVTTNGGPPSSKNTNILLGSIGNSYAPSNLNCAFATIGDGLTDTEAANLYTAVQKYQTTLGRQV